MRKTYLIRSLTKPKFKSIYHFSRIDDYGKKTSEDRSKTDLILPVFKGWEFAEVSTSCFKIMHSIDEKWIYVVLSITYHYGLTNVYDDKSEYARFIELPETKLLRKTLAKILNYRDVIFEHGGRSIIYPHSVLKESFLTKENLNDATFLEEFLTNNHMMVVRDCYGTIDDVIASGLYNEKGIVIEKILTDKNDEI